MLYVPDLSWVLWLLVTIAACVLLLGLAVRRFFSKTRYCTSNAKLWGKTVIVTGGNSGIGLETAIDLARRGARVILGCRNSRKAEVAVQEIKDKTGNNNIEYRHLDLSDLDSVRTFADEIMKKEPQLDILINNAGIGGRWFSGQATKQGFDLTFGTNHVGHFLLTYMLKDLLIKSAPSRIVIVSSLMHRVVRKPLNFESKSKNDIRYPNLKGYPISKLANVMHSRQLAQELQGTGVTVNALHPGFVNSNLWETETRTTRDVMSSIFRPIRQLLAMDNTEGAQTSIHLAVDESLQFTTGKYFNCLSQEETPKKLALDDHNCRRLWNVSMEMCGLK